LILSCSLLQHLLPHTTLDGCATERLRSSFLAMNDSREIRHGKALLDTSQFPAEIFP
jgi:hypothetical protein